jgi:hypothetical protein
MMSEASKALLVQQIMDAKKELASLRSLLGIALFDPIPGASPHIILSEDDVINKDDSKPSKASQTNQDVVKAKASKNVYTKHQAANRLASSASATSPCSGSINHQSTRIVSVNHV